MKTEHTKDTNVISMDKQYTRNGKKVRVLCVDRNCKYFPVVVMDEDGTVNLHTQEGRNEIYNASMFDLKEYSYWQDVDVDTPVLVTYSFDGGDFYHKRHFSHYDAGKDVVYVFGDGKTSYTAEAFDVVSTATAKLA